MFIRHAACTRASLWLLAVAAAACTGAPRPSAELDAAQGALAAAERLHAPSFALSNAHLNLARDALARGMRHLAAGEHEEARAVLVEAREDAAVAELAARVAATRIEARNLAYRAALVEAELERRTSSGGPR